VSLPVFFRVPTSFLRLFRASSLRRDHDRSFRRISEGPDKGGYVHEHFIKGRKSLCNKIKRKKPSIKLPPPGLSYVNPSLLTGGFNQTLSVRQLIADSQLSAAGGQQFPIQQQTAFAGLASLGGFNASALAALLMERQQLEQQHQQANLLQQVILRQQQERELKLLEQQLSNQKQQDRS